MVSTMAQLRFSPLSKHTHSLRRHFSASFPSPHSLRFNLYSTFQHLKSSLPSRFDLSCGGGSGNDGIRGGNGRGDGGGGGNEGGDSDSDNHIFGFGILGVFLNGWRSRMAADPEFAFKVLMEELVGVSANVIGDMASRPNFGLNELDFVFSTLVVGCIVNFTIMYLLAPTLSTTSARLPGLFASCPPSHMFEPGAYGPLSRLGTFVYKGIVFSGVGFAAGLIGTAVSNGLVKLRKKMDPNFVTPNKPPPTVLNALTWAIHMGVNANFRYQTLNGVEFLLAKGLPPLAFKTSVTGLRLLNNVAGGMTFVMLARMTGSQGVGDESKSTKVEEENLVDNGDLSKTD